MWREFLKENLDLSDEGFELKLNQPASLSEIEAAEQALGAKSSSERRELLLEVNGVSLSSSQGDEVEVIMPLETILDICLSNRETDETVKNVVFFGSIFQPYTAVYLLKQEGDRKPGIHVWSFDSRKFEEMFDDDGVSYRSLKDYLLDAMENPELNL